MSKRSVVWTAVAAVSVLLGAAVQTAYGATVSVTESSIDYVAAPGEANRLTVDGERNEAMVLTSTITFTDPGALITVGAGCHSQSAHVATCDESADSRGGYTFAIELGDGNDTAKFINADSSQESQLESSLYDLIFELNPGPGGVPGNPYPDIDGGPGNDVLEIGEEAVDAAVLRGGTGNDQLIGNSESDVLIPGPGADVITGGDGNDAVSYNDRTADVKVSFDGVANDGEAGEGDNVGTDVEGVATGSGNDTVGGSASANEIFTGDGNDRVYAGGGSDRVDSGAGNDIVYGGDGGDDISVGAGNDFVAGGAGGDRLQSESFSAPVDQGADQYYGGAGQDTLSYVSYFGNPRTSGVRVTLDDHANDGASGEGDNVHDDIEIVKGTQFDDVLIGDERSNWLIGDGGHDRLIGGAGIDILDDDSFPLAASYIDGGAGTDIINSWNASDTVICGQGVDILGSRTLHPADCEIVDRTHEVVNQIELACQGGNLACTSRINSVQKRG